MAFFSRLSYNKKPAACKACDRSSIAQPLNPEILHRLGKAKKPSWLRDLRESGDITR